MVILLHYQLDINADMCAGVFNYYPLTTEKEKSDNAVGLGSHTDLQLFTLLWQDHVGGLQVLNKEGQWIKVKYFSYISAKVCILTCTGASGGRNNCCQHWRLHDAFMQRYLQINCSPCLQPCNGGACFHAVLLWAQLQLC